jgi:hypothetical protein
MIAPMLLPEIMSTAIPASSSAVTHDMRKAFGATRAKRESTFFLIYFYPDLSSGSSGKAGVKTSRENFSGSLK